MMQSQPLMQPQQMMQPAPMMQTQAHANIQVTPKTSNHGGPQTNAQVNANSHQEEHSYSDPFEQEDKVATEETEFFSFTINHKAKKDKQEDTYWIFDQEDKEACMPSDYDIIDIAVVCHEPTPHQDTTIPRYYMNLEEEKRNKEIKSQS